MRCGRRGLALGLVLLALTFCAAFAEPRDVQKLQTPGGIGLWLVEEHGLPLVALRFAMRGGSLQDPPGQEGAGDVLAAMLDQGAGPLDAEAFQSRLEALGSRLSFSVSRTALSGGFVSVSRHLDETAALLRLALIEPRLQPSDFERVRAQKMAAAAQDAHNPDRLALRLFYETAFAGHPYARPIQGTPETLGQLTAADMTAQRATLLRRSGLHVVVVGALAAPEAAALVDRIFAGLPEGAAPAPLAPAQPMATTMVVPALDAQPLETAIFAIPMPRAGEPAYFAALALNHVLGSGNFDARLSQELRVKRGLTYAIATHLLADPATSLLLGTLSTRPGMMDEALGTVRATLLALQRGGPSERELANAKSSLNGSYLVGVDGNARLAEHLLGLWLDGLDANYDDQRKAGIDAISLDDARQVARAFFDAGAMRQLILRPVGPD
jgi:zinc protease